MTVVVMRRRAMGQPRNGTRVLIVDDEKTISDTLATILKMHGFEADAVYSGAAAVERVDSFSPDILLSDVRMWPMGGIEAARRIREIRPGCRIVLLSGALMDDLDWSAIEEQGFEYLDKPIPPECLVAHLKAGSAEGWGW